MVGDAPWLPWQYLGKLIQLIRRLSSQANIQTLIVALFAVVGLSGIGPAEIGLILTFTTQLSQLLIVITRQSTEVEVKLHPLSSEVYKILISLLQNYMNAVERGSTFPF
jgi:hypothetical protein